MKKIKSNQKGFGVVEVLLVFVILALIGVVGYMVYKNHHKHTSTTATKTITKTAPDKPSIQLAKTYTDPSSLFTVNYPESWTSQSSRINADSAIAFADPNESSLVPTNASQMSTANPSPNSVNVLAFTSSDTQAVLKQNTFGDSQSSTQNLKVNGYSVLYQQDMGTSQSPSFTENHYAVTHNGVTLVFSFRIKQSSSPATSTSGASNGFDDSGTVPTFEAIVKSVKFLN